MKRTIVNLVSEQTTPNFMFIKEMKNVDDDLLFITSEKFESRIEWITNALGYKNCTVNNIVLENGTEEQWDDMIAQIKKNLSAEMHYTVNITCGTKFMISAIPTAFQSFDAEFYYIPFPRNVILKVGGMDAFDIKYRLNIREFFDCNNTNIPNQKSLTETKEYTKCFFEMFINDKLRFDIIESIRIGYRGHRIDIKKIENKEHTEKKPQIKELSNFLSEIGFPTKENGFLTKDETVYLTGGWFEEYVYSLIEETVKPKDIALGIGLPISEKKTVTNRDLDVVFTHENKLFVVECKTSIDRESILSETVYKAAALKNERLGKLSANTFIFSLSEENEQFKEIAKALNITYYDRSFFTDREKLEKLINGINKKARG
jgi:hypothetical protein